MIRRTLQTERLGPLPIINHFVRRTGLDEALDRHVPSDLRCAVPHARALGLLLRSIIVVKRRPILTPPRRATLTPPWPQFSAAETGAVERSGTAKGSAASRGFPPSECGLALDVAATPRPVFSGAGAVGQGRSGLPVPPM
jgi:hypothetical protein